MQRPTWLVGLRTASGKAVRLLLAGFAFAALLLWDLVVAAFRGIWAIVSWPFRVAAVILSSVKTFAFALALALIGAWAFSQARPESFGTCRLTVLRVGTTPFVKECQPYGISDFAVPVGILALILVFTSEEEAKLGIPGLFVVEKKAKAGRQEANRLIQEDETLALAYKDFREMSATLLLSDSLARPAAEAGDEQGEGKIDPNDDDVQRT